MNSRATLRVLGHAGLLGCPTRRTSAAVACPFDVYLQVLEELAHGWLSVGPPVSVHSLSCFPLATAGTPEQQQKWLPDMLAGDLLEGVLSPSRTPGPMPRRWPPPAARRVTVTSSTA